MKMGLYSIEDIRVDVFKPPFAQLNNAEAIRNFENLCKNPDTDLYRHPDDFRLVRVGEWDDDTGTPTANEKVTLSWAKDFSNGNETSTET